MKNFIKLTLIASLSLFSTSSKLMYGMEPENSEETLTNELGALSLSQHPLGSTDSSVVEQEQIEAFARLSPSPLKFNWIDDELTRAISPGIHPRVGGMARPRSEGEIRDLKKLGVRVFVTLTEEPWNAHLITELGPVVVVKYSPADVVATLAPTALANDIARAQLAKITELNMIAERALRDGLSIYLHLPVIDAPGVPQIDKEQVALFFQVASAAIDAHHSVVVHCQEGINRTGLLLNYWLRLKRSCARRDAMRLVLERRGSITVVTDRLAVEVGQLLRRLEAPELGQQAEGSAEH